MTHITRILALALMTLFMPLSVSHAAIFFDTDWETCTVLSGNDFPCEGWDDGANERPGIPPNVQSGTAVVQTPYAALTGTKGLRGIQDNKGTPGVSGGNTRNQNLTKMLPAGVKHVFARYAYRQAPGFEYCAVNGHTKLVRFQGAGYPKIWIVNKLGSYIVGVEGAYDVGSGGVDTFYSGVLVSTSAWQQIEYEWKMNEPGQANGLMRLWIDGVLRIERLNRQWVGPLPTSTGLNHPNLTPSTLTITNTQIYLQCGLGTQYYDRFAVGSTRIGLIGTGLPVDAIPPATPAGWTVQ